MKAPVVIPDGWQSRRREGGLELEFTIPADYVYLEGHFPGNPLVPGVAQVGWAAFALQELCGRRPRVVRRFRFVRPVKPGERIVVSVVEGAKGYVCEVRADGELASKGALKP